VSIPTCSTDYYNSVCRFGFTMVVTVRESSKKKSLQSLKFLFSSCYYWLQDSKKWLEVNSTFFTVFSARPTKVRSPILYI